MLTKLISDYTDLINGHMDRQQRINFFLSLLSLSKKEFSEFKTIAEVANRLFLLSERLRYQCHTLPQK